MNILVRQLCIVITFSSPPLLSQYKVQRTDPLASISSSLQLFSLQAEDGTTATLRCPKQTKVDFSSYLLCVSHLTLTSHTSLSHLTSHILLLSSHFSHLTPHTSHLTSHTSHLTPHTSHLTPHTSHLTPHTSPLQTSNFTSHTSNFKLHLTPHTSHLTQRSAM